MKKTFLLAVLIGWFCKPFLQAQTCESETYGKTAMEYAINNPSPATSSEFSNMLKTLPSHMFCHAKIEDSYLVAFYDSLQQQHLAMAFVNEDDLFHLTVFKPNSSVKEFWATFRLNGADRKNRLLSYNDSYELAKAPFKNFEEYWNMYFSKQDHTHQ